MTNSKIMTINATDPNNVTFDEFATGCNFGDGEMSIGILGGFPVTLKDGVITGVQQGLYVKDTEGMYYANLNGAFQIVLPGVTPKDYTFNLNIKTTCITDGTVSFSAEVGADVATVMYIIYPDAVNEATLVKRTEYVTKYGTVLDKSQYADFTYTMVSKKETISAVALNEAGEVVKSLVLSYYDMSDDPDQWEDCGNVTFRVNLFCNYFSEIPMETLTVPFQRNKTNKGRLRLVNPYSDSKYSVAYNCHSDDHNHFIVLNVEDPEMIYLEESPLGVDFGDEFGFGMFRLWSYAGYYLRIGYTKENMISAGVVMPVFDKESNTIQFPLNSLITSAMTLNYGLWSTLGGDDNTIAFPAEFNVFGGVDDITVDADAAPARYYNLQGVSVANPVAGQLYIRVQGDKATKVVY